MQDWDWAHESEARRSDAYGAGLRDGLAAFKAGKPASSCDPADWDERYAANYRNGWEHAWHGARRDAATRVWKPGQRYPYSGWTRADRREEARTRASEWHRFTRMTDGELRAQIRTLADTSETCYQDLARFRCALTLANRNGVTVWPVHAA